MKLQLLVCIWAFSLSPLALADSNWPQFRGADSRGVSTEKELPDDWSTTKNVAWSVVVPGRGWSSPVVWGNKVFLTSAVTKGEKELPKKGLYRGGERPEPSSHEHDWVVVCVEAESGETIWRRVARSGKPDGPVHIKNTYASETPVTDGERLYAYFGNVGLFVYDLDGELVWTKKWKPVKTRYGWGTAASPVLRGGRLYILNDNEEDSFLAALDAKTGTQLWQVSRDEASNWSTPFVWENSLRKEIVTPGSGKTRSYDLNGKLLWEFEGMSSITIATPFSDSDFLYVASGFVLDRHRPLYAIRPGASGDISLKKGETSSKFIAWCDPDAAPYNPTPVVYGEYLYVLFDGGFFTCHDARTGEQVYGKVRITRETSGFTSSPWAYDGKVFCLSEDGDTFVIKAGPSYELLRTNRIDEMCMSTPAIAGGSLFIRTFTKLYRIRNQSR